LKTVNTDETERDELRRTLGDIHEDTIFIIICDNRVNGVSASEIEDKIKNKNLKLSRQTIHYHLSELLKKHRIYKVSRRYFPKSSPLNEISTISARLNDVMNFVLDPVFSLEPLEEESSKLNNKLYTYPGFKITHDFKSIGPAPIDYLMNTVTGPVLSKKYHKPSIRNQEEIEKMLFEFINRIGSYIVYIFMESLRPITGHQDLSREYRKELSTKLIEQTLRINELFNMFQYLISNLSLAEVSLGLDYSDIFQLDKKSFQKLSTAYREIYPKMYEALENWEFHGRVFWLKLDTYLASIRDCNHIWEDYTLHKVGNCYHCRDCDLITEQKVYKTSPDQVKQRIHDAVFN
jgi:hypothetical protein